MNILVIGLGSMGRRRIRLLRQHFHNAHICGIDLNAARSRKAGEELEIDTCYSVKQAMRQRRYDYAIVCTAPLSHAEIISTCLREDMHVFTEINLVPDGYQDNMKLAEDRGRVLFLSSTFLYRDEVQFMIGLIRKSRSKLCYTYHIGQYLPDWHPWESYKDFFVGDKRTNACREIFAIELPWLLQAFGCVKHLHVQKRNMSSLPLDYPDQFFVVAEHESGHWGQLAVDVVTRLPVRHFEVFGEDLQLDWRGVPEHLFVWDGSADAMRKVEPSKEVDRQAGYRAFAVENAYAEELKEFFAICNGKPDDVYGFAEDLNTLELIDRIEQGALQ